MTCLFEHGIVLTPSTLSKTAVSARVSTRRPFAAGAVLYPSCPGGAVRLQSTLLNGIGMCQEAFPRDCTDVCTDVVL